MELIDIYDSNKCIKTGEIVDKDIAHELGLWHSAIHLIIFNKAKNKVLLQQRCEDKKLFPNMWDVSVGGHIGTGEEVEDALKRELLEELGLDLDDYDYSKLGVYKEEFINNGINSKEYVFSFVIYADIDIKDIKLQKEEVSNVCWFKLEEFLDLIKENKFINHIEEIEIIRNILQ